MKIKLQLILIASFAFALAACEKSEQPVKEDIAEAKSEAPKAEITSESAVVEHTEKPGVTYSSVETLRSKVLEIDQETREVTLAGQDGEPVVFIASDDVRNLAQVSKGDELAIDYIQRVNIELVPNDGKEAIAAVAAGMSEATRAEAGEMPGATEISSTVEFFEVVDINQENNTFKLKDVNGNVEEYLARKPENLAKAKVGDAVVITTEEAFAIGVNKLNEE